MKTSVDATVIVLGYSAEFCAMYKAMNKIIVIEDIKKGVKITEPNVTLIELPILDDNCFNTASKLLEPEEVVFFMSQNDVISTDDLNKIRLRMLKAYREYTAGAFCIMVNSPKGKVYQARASIGHGFMFGTNPPKPIKNIAYISDDLEIKYVPKSEKGE